MALSNSPNVNRLLRFWDLSKGLFGDKLIKRQNREFKIALVGSESNRAIALSRLGVTESLTVHYSNLDAKLLKSEPLRLLLGENEPISDTELKEQIMSVLVKNKDYRIAIAAQSALLRPLIVDQISKEWARHNAKRAMIDAIPGIFTGFDFLLPFTGAGDMVALTRNQIEMVLEIAACHNLPPDPKTRLTELIPVIGSAFGWRAVARQLTTFAPFGTGMIISGSLAYAGTLAVGKSVDYYYTSGGKTLDLGNTFQNIAGESIAKVKDIADKVASRKRLTRFGTAMSA